MTVQVTMLPSALPEGHPQDNRTIAHEDDGDTRYTYQLHSSGALLIAEGRNSVVTYSPSAWESVQGDTN